jgi:hypothetical protein
MLNSPVASTRATWGGTSTTPRSTWETTASSKTSKRSKTTVWTQIDCDRWSETAVEQHQRQILRTKSSMTCSSCSPTGESPNASVVRWGSRARRGCAGARGTTTQARSAQVARRKNCATTRSASWPRTETRNTARKSGIRVACATTTTGSGRRNSERTSGLQTPSTRGSSGEPASTCRLNPMHKGGSLDLVTVDRVNQKIHHIVVAFLYVSKKLKKLPTYKHTKPPQTRRFSTE